MSIYLMSKIWKSRTGLTATEKLVLLKLADNANDDGVCWPSHDSIAAACEISKRSVIRAIKAIEAKAMINVTRKRLPNGLNACNVYDITPSDRLSLLTKQVNKGSDNLSPCSDKTGNNHVTKQVNKGDEVSPKSSVNHHIETSLKEREEKPPSQEKDFGTDNHVGTKNELTRNPLELPDENKHIASGNDPFAQQFDEHETTMRKLMAVGCKGFVQNREHWIGLVAEHGLELVLAAARKTDASNRWSSDVERTIQAKQDGAGHLSDLTEEDECPI